MLAKINNIDDIKEFARQLVKEGVSFHPDDDFEDYVNWKTNEPVYSPEEVAFRNDLMRQCFEVCEGAGEDVYAIMGDELLLATGMDKFIPLSTAEVA